MYTLKEIRKILNIQEQDRNKDSWSDGDVMEDNKGDGKPFTPFELAILKLIHQNLSPAQMGDILIDHIYPGEAGKKWQNIAKLVGLRSMPGRDDIEDIAYDKKYVKWALDNWAEDGDYGSIEKPIKTPAKKYDVEREESGTQVIYKDGSATVIAYDEENASDTADAQFWDWGGEMEDTDYGDWETHDSSITDIVPLEVLSEEKQKEFNGLVKLCQLGEKYTPKIVGGVTRETLTQFLKENINDMVYRDEPKKKHVKRMNSGLGPLTGFPIERFKNMPPPENESIETEEEIDYLDSIPVEKNFIESADDIDQYFKKFLESKELEFPEEELKGVMKGVKSIILQLKYHYNRPRPYQVAKAKNLQLDSEHLKSASTPSYPSGHATQGTFLGRYLADLYPEYGKELRQIGEDITFSRNMAKVHYPSDSELGKMLGNDLYEFVYQQEEELNEQTESSLEYGGDKLLVPIKSLEQYGNEYLKKDLKKILTNILECIERTCYHIGEQPYFLSMIDDDGESVQRQSTCSDCTHLLDETLVTLDAELIKMGFLKGNDTGVLVKPFPKEYNRWVESIIQEINPGFFIDDKDEVSYKQLGNAYDAYYDLSEQISPEALQDLYAFHGEEFENEMDEEVKPSTQLSGDQSHLINTLEKLQEKRNIGNKVKDFTNKKKEDFKNFWSKLPQGAKRERKETAEAVRIIGRLISNKDSVTKEDIKFLKQQSGDIARIITLVSLGAVSVVIPVGLEKLLNQYGISIMPKKRGKDEDGNGIDDHIDVTQNDNLLKEQQEISPKLEIGDKIKVIGVDEKHERMPELFTIVYQVRRKWESFDFEGEAYSIYPEDRKMWDEKGVSYTRKHIYPGDVWIKVNPTETLNESKEEVSPVLKYGDVITILDIPTPTIGFGVDKSREERQSYAFGEPQLFKPYWVWKPSYGTPKREGTYIIVPLDEVSELQKLGHLKPEDEGLPGHLHRKLKKIRRSGGDQWVKTNQTEPLNESKQQEISPKLEIGDKIKVIQIDGEHERMPKLFTTVYEVIRKGDAKWTRKKEGRFEWYDLLPENFREQIRKEELVWENEFKSIYHQTPQSSGDVWIKVNPTQTLNETKQEFNPELKQGDFVRIYDVDKVSPVISREGYVTQDRYMLYGGDSIPEMFKVYVVMLVTKHKVTQSGTEGEKMYVLLGPDMDTSRPLYLFPSHDTWVKLPEEEGNGEFMKELKTRQREVERMGLNESTQTNQPLKRGDEVMIVDLDHSTQGNMTGRLPISIVTPDTFKPYRIFGITYRQRENWEGPNDDTRIYQLEPVDITDEERNQEMISGGGRRRGLHMLPGDTWILQKRPENWYDNLHESKQEEINPRLDIGDKIKVIEIDGEHARMPELFTTVYEVVRKRDEEREEREGKRMEIRGGRVVEGEWYDLLPEGYEVIGRNGERDVRSDWKSIFKGDVWIKVNSTETISEQREPTKLNPELKMGDEIMVVDVDSERESGNTSYTSPPTGHKSERYIPYVVVEKNSNGHQSEWPWKYVVVEKRFLEKILKLMEEKPGYDTDWTENLIEMNAKFLYPWVYQWIKTGEFNGLSKFGLTETLNEQQFPFNRDNKDMERDHPEGEPDWSIRRGNQHYAMNVENTPNEPVAAFNNYLVKNSPFIIEGFDFYLSAVPGNMPQSAIVDVYVPMMDDSAIADDIWNKDRIYYERTEDWSSDRTKYQGRKEKLHNLDYDQEFAEFTYYEDFQDQHPEYVEYLKQELGDTNLLNEPGAQYEMIWRTKRMNLQNELDAIAKLFGVGKVRINRDPRKPWKRQGDSYDNEKIRPGKLVPREWPRT